MVAFSKAEHRSLPPDDRHTRATECARLRAVTNSRNSWRSHVHRTCTAQRVQPFKIGTANAGGRGERPSPFSGGSKGGILFGKRIPPLPGSGAQRRTINAAPAALRSLPLKGEIKGKLSSEREYPLCLAVALSAALSMQRNALRSLPFLGAQKKSRPMGGSHFCSISQCG